MGDVWANGVLYGWCMCQWGDVCVMYGPVCVVWVMYG